MKDLYLQGWFTDIRSVRRFIFAGNATITLVSKKTGARFTYKIKQAKNEDDSLREFWFVSLLRGPDNDSDSDYQYLGYFGKWRSYWYGQKSKISAEAPSAKAFDWFAKSMFHWDDEKRVAALFEGLEIWHEGKCGRCNRKLTVPDSIASGFGPECAKYL